MSWDLGDEVNGEWVEEPKGGVYDEEEDDMGPWIRRMTAVG